MTATASAPRCSGRPTATPASPSATPGKLHLPAIQDPVYGYQSVNVEAQLENPSSLLHWNRRMIQIRARATTRSASAPSATSAAPTRSVLSYAREHVTDDGSTEIVLCVNNLSRFPQPVELDLRRFEGMRPIELLGGVPFPAIGELPYLLTLSWLRLLLVPADRGRRPGRRPAAVTSRSPRDRGVRRLPRPNPVVRRQGPPVRRHRRAHASASSRAGPPVVVDPPGRGHLLRRGGRDRALPGAAGRSTREPENRLDHAFVGWWEDPDHGWVHAYDALHDREAMALWQRAFDAAQPESRRAPVPPAARATSSTWRRTRRCSAASSPTPRWPSARTR